MTAGHLATCPRMLKAADALAGAGYPVRMVSARFLDWAWEADLALRSTRDWEWDVVHYDRRASRWTYLASGLRCRTARALARSLGAARCPVSLAARAFGRVHPELLRAALARPADLYYGGTTGALCAVATAARRSGTRYALDLEDFHSAEQEPGRAASLSHALAERIESAILPGAAFLTAGSEAIAAAYSRKYGLDPVPLANTFPLPARAPDPDPSPGAGLRLCWFSQTIGPGRGIEDAVRAAGESGVEIELHLRGQPLPGYLDRLRALARDTPVPPRIVHHPPALPDEMVEFCRGCDVGLALEQTRVDSRALCLTNKAFTYMLAGLAVVFTDTPGQRPLALDLGQGALLVPPGDVAALAAGLRRWAANRASLAQARAAAWDAARLRWHWELPAHRGRLLELVARILGSPRVQ